MKDFIGVLGGMGPMATADFMKKIIINKNSPHDQDHVPLMIYSFPGIPDRSNYIINRGASPLAELVEGILCLERNGASCIAIPCNTAHFWYDDLERISNIPILNIVDCVGEYLMSLKMNGQNVIVLGTDGTLASGIYESRLGQLGYKVIFPDKKIQTKYIMPAIRGVKEGNLKDAEILFEGAIKDILEYDISAIVLACTELPIIYQKSSVGGIAIIDSTDALARGVINWFDKKSNDRRSASSAN